MNNNTINGHDFRKMVFNALKNISNAEKRVNSMNVFPVADGDTGTNMRLTLENGYNKAQENQHLGEYLKQLSSGMLLGARGNSGVILSQLFKGIYLKLQRCSIANPREIKEAFINAYNVAYAAVVNPVEGTILTVAREGIENIKDQIRGKMPVSSVFSLYLSELRKSQERTPELLPVLKEAGVLDSGAEGYIVIIEGMYKSLIGEDITSDYKEIEVKKEENKKNFFDENSKFEKGYCMEFLLQLMNSKNYKKRFSLESFIETLKMLGNSLVVLQEGTIVKVHIHTFVPNEVMFISRQYGEYISFKLENMQLQHNEYIHEQKKKEKLPHKDFGIIAVIDGSGIEDFIKSMGVDIVIQGGQTMNTSSEEFVNALEIINADHVVIFPNNNNIFEAANQAIKVSNMNNVTIIPTKSVLECYYALAMDVPGSNYKDRIKALNEGREGILSLSISSAVKDYNSDSFTCKKGDKIGCIDGKMVVNSDNTLDAFKALIAKVENIEDKSGIIIFKGKGFDESLQDEMNDFVQDEYSLEIEFVEGGQHVYELLIGVI